MEIRAHDRGVMDDSWAFGASYTYAAISHVASIAVSLGALLPTHSRSYKPPYQSLLRAGILCAYRTGPMRKYIGAERAAATSEKATKHTLASRPWKSLRPRAPGA